MTTKQNAIDLANTARSFSMQLQVKSGVKISAFENDWNICVQQAGFTGIFDVPNGYKRRSHLISDLERIAAQLDDYVEPVIYPEGYSVEQQIREFNATCTRVLDVEEAHSQALEINDAYNCAYTRPGAIFQEAFFEVLNHIEREVTINRAHTEALGINTKLYKECA
jgi:hypothetical protein